MGGAHSLPGRYRIEEVEIADPDESLLEPLLAVINGIGTERQPRAVDFTVDEFREFSNSPLARSNHRAVTDERGSVVAFLSTRYRADGSNPSLLQVSIGVRPQHRRRGIGVALLGGAVDQARMLGRTSLAGEIYDTVPAGASFATAIGATKTRDMHLNAVRIDRLDRELLGSWRSAGPARAPGYSVRVIEGMYPDELIEGLVPLYVVVERDSPSPEGHEPRNWTAEMVRTWLSNHLRRVDLFTAIAIEDSSGTPVGMSQLGRRHNDVATWFVTITMVDPKHRGRALGKWVKAAACLTALEMWPQAVWMETGNALANEPMLAINLAMGFRHELTVSDVEVTVDRAADYLASRSG